VACSFQYAFPLSEQPFAVGLLLLTITPMLARWRKKNKVWCSRADLRAFLLTHLKGLSASTFQISQDTETGLKNRGFFPQFKIN